MGKLLRKLQVKQKKEQKEAKAKGEEPQTWKDWCAEEKACRACFPTESQCGKYMLISTFPKAYVKGMSIKEAYRKAGEWKRNGGKEPAPKKTISSRPLVASE